MPLICTFHLPTLSCSFNPNLHHHRPPPPPPPPRPSSHPPALLRFRTSHLQTTQHLATLGIHTSSLESLDWALTTITYLKSKSFSDSHIPRLAQLCPDIFTADIDRTLAPVFAFLVTDLSLSPQQSRDIIHRCPSLLLATHRLKPTLSFLRSIGVKNLANPTNLNAHLLNTPVEKLAEKIRFLEEQGLSGEVARGACARFPAMFGYSVENNMAPKVEYLVGEMEREVGEVGRFPQFFGFSLEGRIAPRHLHLKERNLLKVPLRKVLPWSDKLFYAKWK